MFIYGQPLEIPRKLSDADLERCARELEERFEALGRDGESDFEALWRAASL